MANNNTANVSVGKGVVGGYLFTAPVGTPLPTDFSTALNAAFVNVGFLSDEGISSSTDASSDDYKDLNGDTVLTAVTSRNRKVKLQFLEINEVSAKEVYGQQNVTIGADGSITIRHNNLDMEHRSMVGEFVLRDGRKFRRVWPDARVTDWDDTTIVSSELYALPVTYSLAPDADGQYVYDYIAPVETTSETTGKTSTSSKS